MSESPTLDRMSDTDALAWSIEHDPRLRSPMSAVLVLDGPLDRNRILHTFERASRVVPRMRHRVVPDPAGLAPPCLEVDPDFSLGFHVRVTNIGGGTERDLLDLAEAIVLQGFDRSRPLWEATLVEGLAEGRSGLVLKSHHAISDGLGAVRMMFEIFDLQPEPTPGRETLPPAPEPDPRSEDSHLRSAVDHEAHELIDAVRRSFGLFTSAATDPAGAARVLSDTLVSAGRVLRPAPEPLSPIMIGRSLGLGFDYLTVALADLKGAGGRVGGSINDAFIASILIGVAGYHRAHGHDPERMRVAIPINRRDQDDLSVGNYWTPSRAELPLDVADPDELMRVVHGTVTRLRSEAAYEALGGMAGVLRRLPDSMVASLFASMSAGVDLAASNVPGSPVPLYLAGREIVKLVPFGPLTGAASNVTLFSLADRAHIGVARDPAAVPDGEAFSSHIARGFDTVITG